MRFRTLATVAVAALLAVPSILLGQSLAEAAAREKARRKALEESGKKPARSYSDEDLGRAKGANASFPTGPDGSPAAGTADEKKGAGAPGTKETEKTEDEKKAEATAAWRKKLDTASKAASTYRDQIAKIQNDLNDTSSGLYSSRRTTLLSFLDETQKKLADAERQVGDLQDEGRRNGYQ
jgi:hypothetical protein